MANETAASEAITHWKNKIEIDYITHFATCWIAFNAWYGIRYHNKQRDRDKINEIKNDSNDPFHKAMQSLLEVKGESRTLFLQHIENLHHSLEQAQIRMKNDEAISLNKAIATSEQFREIQKDDSKSIDEEFYKLQGCSLIRDTTNLTDPGHLVIKELIEVLYQLRNKLFHGELVPDKQANSVYQNAYQIMNMLIPKLI